MFDFFSDNVDQKLIKKDKMKRKEIFLDVYKLYNGNFYKTNKTY